VTAAVGFGRYSQILFGVIGYVLGELIPVVLDGLGVFITLSVGMAYSIWQDVYP
jgi:hypothetical protein